MGRPSLSKRDYILLGREKGLEHLGQPPSSIRVKTTWKCIETGEVLARTYLAVKAIVGMCGEHGNTHSMDKYVKVGKEYSLTPCFDSSPKSVHDTVQWKCPNGRIIYASYYELGYKRYNLRLKKELIFGGVDEDIL